MESSSVNEDSSSVASALAPSHARLQPSVEDGDPFISHSAPNNGLAILESAPLARSAAFSAPKGKEKAQTDNAPRMKPLNLLDLPVDILREIINQLPHTNDLTSLALCHSVLHSLAIPCIYSRFDIVWPDTTTQSEPRSGVDALTYGLSTLVMAEELFGETQWQRAQAKHATDSAGKQQLWRRRRRGNHYAQYTKKFSLGNGPLEYVQEYLVTKEGGKMLGTLVALAVARMRNLETFVWDMPTGVLREVWLALSSLDDREDGQDCRLEKVWIRWHNNESAEILGAVPPPPTLPPIVVQHAQAMSLQAAAGLMAAPPAVVSQAGQFIPVSGNLDRVEHPTFSVLPPLKSLTVLDIDELPYLDEMSILIASSQHKLRELRIGIAEHVVNHEWVQVWDGDSLQQVDYDSSSTLTSKIGNSRLGGPMGVLLGRVYNMRNNARSIVASTMPSPGRRGGDLPTLRPSLTSIDGTVQTSYLNEAQPRAETPGSPASPLSDSHGTTFQSPIGGSSLQLSEASQPPVTTPSKLVPPYLAFESVARQFEALTDRSRGPYLDGQLRLESLGLERVPISVSIIQRAFDWSVLTSLTLLDCPNHEQLWKSLRHLYSHPKQGKSQNHTGTSLSSPPYTPVSARRASASLCATGYSLSLKKIHTNTASIALLNFIKDTLAPNSLEVFFLQDNRSSPLGLVPVESIHRAVMKRHRASLKKLMIDSSASRDSTDYTTNVRYRRWMMNRDILAFITSGKMPKLRELGLTIDYKDWHFFLQNLPSIPHLRSLYIPHLPDHPHGAILDPRELALQIVDIVTLRVDIELCYLGIGPKCFEILENKNTSDARALHESHSGLHGADSSMPPGYTVNLGGLNAPTDLDDDGDADDDEDHDPDEDAGAEDDDDPDAPAAGGEGQSESEEEFDDESNDSDGYESAGEGGASHAAKAAPKLRLREILFYDDKVAVFKARHGRL